MTSKHIKDEPRWFAGNTAEFMIHASKCHHELLEALKMAVNALEGNDIGKMTAREFEILTDAISKAEREEVPNDK